ncbi:MAG: carotenoid biosynthesis protein [Rhizomicrobium sp.]
MERVLRVVDGGLFALVAYFIVTNIVYPWVDLPSGGDLVFVPTFTAFSLLHAGLRLGAGRTALFFGLTVVISFIAEEAGVRTGLVFGRYYYSDMLGPKLGHVPVLVPLGWFMMIYPSWVVAQSLLRGVDLRRPLGMVALALLSALTMTGWDMVMDPPMAAAHNWVWLDGGPHFGVPLHNYFGWVANTFVIYLAFDTVDRLVARRDGAAYRFGGLFAALPVALYCLFSLQYLSPWRLPELRLIAVFSMVVPGAVALVRLALPAAPDGRTESAPG